MNHNQHSDSLTCAVIHDPENGKMCGTEGDAGVMFYSRLPDGTVIVACPTCNTLLDTGFKAAGKPYRYATVASVRALANFRIEFVDGLQIEKGLCSFRACNCKLDGEMVVRNGEKYRRICNNDASALDIIATAAKEQLALHTTKKRLLAKRDLPEVETQAKLMPESVRNAHKAIRELQEQAHARVAAAKNLAMAQLKTAPKAPKPEVKSQPKPEVKAAPKAATKVVTSHQLPGFIAQRYLFNEKPTVRMKVAGLPLKASPALEAPIAIAPSAPPASAEAQV